MKRYVIIILQIATVYISDICYSQNFANYSIKEQYDQRQKTFIEYGSYNPANVGSDVWLISSMYGDGMSYVLESYIRMYETTRDKAYLIKFIENAITMHEHRRDQLNISGLDDDEYWACNTCCDNTPYDGDGPPCAYHDGLILWAMSHFVFLVKFQEPLLLNNLQLPNIQDTKITENAFGVQLWNTYGEFASWLNMRTMETLNHYTFDDEDSDAYWGDAQRCYTNESNPPNNERALQINKQAGFGCALFYMGITNGSSDYLEKAADIAKAYKGYRRENHPVLNSCAFPLSINKIVLETFNNSYIWDSEGWREQTCLEIKNHPENSDYEDISHAITAMLFPRAINNRLPSQGVWLFSDNEMLRFRNTFANNVFAGYTNNCPNFHAGVDGNDVITYNQNLSGLNTLKIRALAWMPFYKYDYDNAPNKVYDIIMKYYDCDIKNNIDIITYGIDFYGLSEVVAAQWDKECVDLTLYNRDIVYNQDFTVKGNLIVEPQANDFYHSEFDEPFAEPKTFTDGGPVNRFVVDPGVSVKMTAGVSIELGPGFDSGNDFEASVEPDLYICNMQKFSYSGNPVQTETYEKQDEKTGLPETVSSAVCTPNPCNGTFQLSVSGNSGSVVKTVIYNTLGNIILKEDFEGNNKKFDISVYPKGVYIIKVLQGENVFTEKIVYN